MTPCQADLALRREVAETTGEAMVPGAFDLLIDGARGRTLNRAVEQARAMCARCPVWLACLSDNRAQEWVQRIVGTVRSDEPTPDERCGTAKGYSAHLWRREQPCEPCRLAGAARQRAYRQARKAS